MPIDYRNTLNNLTLDDLANWTEMGGGDIQGWLDAVNSGGYGVSERQAIEDFASGYVNFYSNGDGTYTMTGFANQGQTTVTNPVNSNITDIARGEVQTPINVGTNSTTGNIEMSTTPSSGSFGQNAKYFLANVGQAISAASVGIWLGKTIDSALYNANPQYWDSIGMSTLNPETWNSITNGDDSLAAGLFNFIFGLNPDTGKTQAYIDQNALAYLAWALKENGWFSEGGKTIDDDLIQYLPILKSGGWSLPVQSESAESFRYSQGSSTPSGSYNEYTYSTISGGPVLSILAGSPVIDNSYRAGFFVSKNNSKIQELRKYAGNEYTSNKNIGTKVTFNGLPVYHNPVTSYYPEPTYYNSEFPFGMCNPYTSIGSGITSLLSEMGFVALYGTTVSGSPEGVGTQPSSTAPNTSTWTTPATTLTSLQQQYPQMFQDALVWDNVQPDGTNPQLVYVPVPMPELQTYTDPQTGVETLIVSQPVSSISDSSQAQPQIDNGTAGTGIVDLLLRLIQQNPETAVDPETQTETNLEPVPNVRNPVDTGTGDSPSIPVPTGSASALWSVYHPTQAQVDSFGAWLWTGNIITQIQQLLQNPMDGIITLHKVFATPVDAGTGNIVVGRLDSNVSSATVEEQYVTVDCGSIDLGEHFGNVFDYDPFTRISLYLPFIGIVPLNIDDVMRSTISVTYGVDLFTGVCLAMVEVVRDSHTVVMYQYTGVASVEYPLTGSVHSGLINGILGVAGGVAGVAAASTGLGAVAGASAIAGGIANFNRSNNARSGSFSGNAGAMGIKKPYLIIERPQTKVAETFPTLDGYPTNFSIRLGDCSNHVVCKTVHVSGISATVQELKEIESILKSGVEI